MTLFSCIRKKDSKLVKADKYVFSRDVLDKLSVFMYGNMFVKKYMRFISYYTKGGEDFIFFGYNILTGIGKSYVRSNIKRTLQVDATYKFNVIASLSENTSLFNLHHFLYNVYNFVHYTNETRGNVISKTLVSTKKYIPRAGSALNKSIFGLSINSFKSSHFFKNNLRDIDSKEYFKYMQNPTTDILKSIYDEIKKNKQDVTIQDILYEDGALEFNFYYIHFYTPINKLVYFGYLININAFYELSSSKIYSYLILTKILDKKLEASVTKITRDHATRLVVSEEILVDKIHIDFNTDEIYQSIKELIIKNKINMKINIY